MATPHVIKTRKHPVVRKATASSAHTSVTQELKVAVSRLRCTEAVVTMAVGALRYQNAERDVDIATVLQQVVVNSLDGEIARLEEMAAGGRS